VGLWADLEGLPTQMLWKAAGDRSFLAGEGWKKGLLLGFQGGRLRGVAGVPGTPGAGTFQVLE